MDNLLYEKLNKVTEEEFSFEDISIEDPNRPITSKDIIDKIDMGQALIEIAVGMNRGCDGWVDSEWLREDDTVWDYCIQGADEDDFNVILEVAGIDNAGKAEDWLVFGYAGVDTGGYLTGEEWRYASYVE